ncbi:MAG: hypothetical protein K9I26_09195 [Flavobacterium sp.]|nr:hypothetical protein [Flavobacterium sp.]
MITTFLAFFGFVLLVLSVYLLYKNTNNSLLDDKQKKLEEAIKEIEVLHAEIVEKDKLVDQVEKKMKILESDSATFTSGQNIPIIEIVDNDLSDGNNSETNGKRVHKLMYHHQIRFYLLNAGKNSLKDVIFSIKDIYNDPIERNKKAKSIGKHEYMGHSVNGDEIGTYENIELHTLNLKSKKLMYTSNLPGSFGVGDYSYNVVIEWSQGFYQMKINIEETDGKLKYKYDFYDVTGNPIDYKSLEMNISD